MSSTRMNPTEGPATDIKIQQVYVKRILFGSLCIENKESDPFSQYARNK
jgi:hypothetical protein